MRTPYPRTVHACFGEYFVADLAAGRDERDVAAVGKPSLATPGAAARFRRGCDKRAQMRLIVGRGLVSGRHLFDCCESSLTCKMTASTLPGAAPRNDRAVALASWRFSCVIGCLAW